ncbi:hypothetical protein ACIBF1_31210 [Spirillospora sp. NPDC050679]
MKMLARYGTTALLAVSLSTCLAACGDSGDEAASGGPAGKGKGGGAAAKAGKGGCPDAGLLEPVLGKPPFHLLRHNPHRDKGWHCRYEPAARNPNGVRLDVYYDPPTSPGGLTRASGYGAMPEFGPEARWATSCPSSPGTGRLGADFARPGEEHNSHELVFEASGAVIGDCAKQRDIVRGLVKVFYDNRIVPGAAG